jgi:hypothetical protein
MSLISIEQKLDAILEKLDAQAPAVHAMESHISFVEGYIQFFPPPRQLFRRLGWMLTSVEKTTQEKKRLPAPDDLV